MQKRHITQLIEKILPLLTNVLTIPLHLETEDNSILLCYKFSGNALVGNTCTIPPAEVYGTVDLILIFQSMALALVGKELMSTWWCMQ